MPPQVDQTDSEDGRKESRKPSKIVQADLRGHFSHNGGRRIHQKQADKNSPLETKLWFLVSSAMLSFLQEGTNIFMCVRRTYLTDISDLLDWT